MQIKSILVAAAVATTALASPQHWHPGPGWRFRNGGNGGAGDVSTATKTDSGSGSSATCACPVDGSAATYTASTTGGGRPTATPSAFCLSDDAATKYSDTVKTILSGSNRTESQVLAKALLADTYFEVSDSINLLANKTLGGNTFATKDDFVTALAFSTGIPEMDTLDVFHDCDRILWRWKASGFGKNVYPVQGMSVLSIDVKAAQLLSMKIEFNSIAWGTNIGWTCTAPPPRKA